MVDQRHVPASELVGEKIGGRFVVERLIGHGPLSTAFRAHDERLHRRVTVKLFHAAHPDDRIVVDAQLEAARAVARLSHENIAMVIDRGEHEGLPLIVLEHVRGENLAERIERFAPLSLAEVVRYGSGIARALAYAHAHDVVHGNVRPENILISEEHEVKLVDFGGGSLLGHLTGDPHLTPERRDGVHDFTPDENDDIYALGVLLFMAFTEQAPPAGGIDPASLQMMRPDIPPAVADLVARSVAQHPDDRPRAMREISSVFAQVGPSMQQHATPAASADSDAHGDTQDIETAEGRTSVIPTQPLQRTTVAAAPRARRQKQRGSHRARQARLLAWSMVAAPIIVLIIVGVMIAGERASDPVEAGRDAITDAIINVGEAQPVQASSATSYDPGGDGDTFGSEGEDSVANVIDGDVDSHWQSEGYDDGALSLKSGGDENHGVGVIIGFDEPVNLSTVNIKTDLQGWHVTVRAATGRPGALSEWTAVSETVPVTNSTAIEVDAKNEYYDSYLLWITKLSLDIEDPALNKSRARINELTFAGSAK